jgi:Ca2+-binding EF-hand superfamily protein
MNAMGRAICASRIGGVDAKRTIGMKKTIGIALAFATLSAALAGTAYADKRDGSPGRGMGFGMASLETMDADKSSDVTFEEFKKAAGDKFVLADTDKDGKVTVEEMAAAIEKMRAEEMAKRMVTKFDVDGDGAVTAAEIETNQKEMYALLDKNNDGKLVADEMDRPNKKGWFGRKGHHGQGGDNN